MPDTPLPRVLDLCLCWHRIGGPVLLHRFEISLISTNTPHPLLAMNLSLRKRSLERSGTEMEGFEISNVFLNPFFEANKVFHLKLSTVIGRFFPNRPPGRLLGVLGVFSGRRGSHRGRGGSEGGLQSGYQRVSYLTGRYKAGVLSIPRPIKSLLRRVRCIARIFGVIWGSTSQSDKSIGGGWESGIGNRKPRIWRRAQSRGEGAKGGIGVGDRHSLCYCDFKLVHPIGYLADSVGWGERRLGVGRPSAQRRPSRY